MRSSSRRGRATAAPPPCWAWTGIACRNLSVGLWHPFAPRIRRPIMSIAGRIDSIRPVIPSRAELGELERKELSKWIVGNRATRVNRGAVFLTDLMPKARHATAANSGGDGSFGSASEQLARKLKKMPASKRIPRKERITITFSSVPSRGPLSCMNSVPLEL